MNTVILYAGRILRAGGFWGRFCTQGCIQVNTNHVDRVIICELCRCQAVASGSLNIAPEGISKQQAFYKRRPAASAVSTQCWSLNTKSAGCVRPGVAASALKRQLPARDRNCSGTTGRLRNSTRLFEDLSPGRTSCRNPWRGIRRD